MITLLQTNDPVLLSFAQALLSEAGIECVVFDGNISMVEGGIGAFPRRLVVHGDDAPRARIALWEAGLSGELAPDAGS